MNLKELAKIICEVFEIEDITQAETPEGRWNLFQAWLKNNPRWKKRVSQWAEVSPNHAYDDLCEWISVKAELPLTMFKLIVDQETRARVKSTIATIQTLYKERQSQEAHPQHETGIYEIDSNPAPSAHKSLGDYQAQLKAKKKRRKHEV